MTSPFNNIKVPSTLGKVDPNTANFGTIIMALLPFVFGAAGIILIFMIISSGYQMMVSKGDPKVFQAAQGKLTTSLLGILIVFISFWIVNLILKFFDIEFLIPIIN